MDDELAPTWAPRDRPVLRAALERLDAGEYLPALNDLAADTGLSADEVWLGMQALEKGQPPFVELDGTHISAVTERGRRE